MASVASSSSPAAINRTPRILACVLCQHRKIKCDRNPAGCANCAKANVTCTPSRPAPARKRRRPNQDLQERLARCESLLKEYATAEPRDQAPAASRPVQVPVYDDPYLQWKPTGKLVVEDGGVRFMDSFLLGTVYDELKAMRESLNDDDETIAGAEDFTPPETMTPDDNADLIMGGDSPNVNLEDLQPDAGQIFRLWQIYLDRVNPLTKIIHVPTVQPYLAEAASGSLPKNVEPLLFAIYTLAVVSLTPDECQSLLGCTRETALRKFSQGVRLSLIRTGFLKNADLVTLQALVIYLISLQGRYNRHAAWIMNGIVIRIAQKMGFHRDGEILGLTPFETEMRRRVWWQIITVDTKYAMLSGLSHSLIPRSWDTKEPRNINDADLHPSAKEPIQDREGPTEMILSLLTNKVAKFMVQSPGFEPLILLNEVTAANAEGPPTEQLEMYRQIIEELRQTLVELLDKFCDPSAGPLHQMAILVKDMIIVKLAELIAPKTGRLLPGEELPNPRDNAFKVAVKTIEHGINQYEIGANTGFIWFVRLHFQIDVFAYMCGQLCYRTSGAFVEQAWRVVEAIYGYHPELLDTSQKSYSAIATFVLKAWRIREDVLLKRDGALPETPCYIYKLRLQMPQLDMKLEQTPPGGAMNPTPRSGDLPGGSRVGPSPGSSDPGPLNAYLDPQFLNDYLNGTSLDWGLWGSMGNVNPTTSMALGAFGMGPSPEW